MKLTKLFLFIVALSIFFSCKKEEKPRYIKLSGYVFGTTYNITFQNNGLAYQKSIDSLFHLVNKSLSTYIPNSDISKINDGDSTVVIDAYFNEVFKKSKKNYYRRNN